MLTTRVCRYWIWSGVVSGLGFGCFACEQQSLKLPMPLSAHSAEVAPSALAQTTPAPSTSEGISSPNVGSSPDQSGCNNALTQAEMNICAGQMAKTADQALNQVYQKLRASLKDSPRSQKLVDAQLAWIQFRDTHCAFVKSSYEGGSMAPMIFHGCVEGVTKHRTEQLNQYLNQYLQTH